MSTSPDDVGHGYDGRAGDGIKNSTAIAYGGSNMPPVLASADRAAQPTDWTNPCSLLFAGWENVVPFRRLPIVLEPFGAAASIITVRTTPSPDLTSPSGTERTGL